MICGEMKTRVGHMRMQSKWASEFDKSISFQHNNIEYAW